MLSSLSNLSLQFGQKNSRLETSALVARIAEDFGLFAILVA